MYNVLLVEDEILERENMRASWIWENGDFKLCADAANGEDAWRILHEQPIDIVVTDIRMPFMDGLELCRLIKNAYPKIMIIILSGHSDFSYAQKALSLGVNDYIVKPAKSSDLLDALYKVASHIDQDNKLQSELENYKLRLKQSNDLRKQMLLINLVTGVLPTENVIEEAKELSIDLTFNDSCCVIIELFEDKIQISDHEYLLALEIQDGIKEALIDKSAISFSWNLRKYCLILKMSEMTQVKNQLNLVKEKIIDYYVMSGLNYRPVIAIGRIRKGIEGVVESFADAQFVLNFRFLFHNAEIMTSDDSLVLSDNNLNFEIVLMNEKTLIDNLIRYGTKNEAGDLVSKFVMKLKSLNLSYMVFQYICIELISQIKNFLTDLSDDDPVKVINQFSSNNIFQLNHWLSWANDLDKFGANLKELISGVIDIRDKRKNYRYSTIIAIAKEYINKNFSDPDLSLASVANKVNITPNYLSTIFTQETGESFIEYITRLRITKAKELINSTSMRIVDIAFSVGYQDSNYFSKIYRKIAGETPSQTRCT